MTLLEIEGLRTEFPTERGVVEAVADVDMSINHDEIVGLVGESGSGKSVLADSIQRIVDEPGRITDGEIRLEGESIREMDETELREIRGGRISRIFQDPMNSLNPTIRVGEQIAEAIRLHQDVPGGVSFPAEIRRKLLGATENSRAWQMAIELLEAVGIPEPDGRATDYPHQFSGGMRQRAMIAMALSCEPDLLIADEPTTALDVTIQAQILRELEALQTEFDTAILLITHDLAVVAETCDRVNVMYAGEIIERATTEQLFSDPQHPYTQGLIAATPRVDAPRDELTPIPGSVPSLIDVPYACHFAPRCPEAEPECFETEPEFSRVGESGDEHVVACLRRGPEDEQI